MKRFRIKKPLNYWRVAGVIRREHMMQVYVANMRATCGLYFRLKNEGLILRSIAK